MNSLSSWLGVSTTTLVMFGLLGIGAFLVLFVLCIYVYRAISRPHVRNIAGRNRQPRLGVLDSYPVDRVRQLVLVRRDNVEHLIMIGGPNDLVVESGILRGRPGQQPRPIGTGIPAPPPIAERVPAPAIAPKQVEEEFALPVEAEASPAVAPTPARPAFARPEFARPEPAGAAPASVEPTPTPAAPISAPVAKPSVVPPREPGFFQRATSRIPFGRQTPTLPTPLAMPAETAEAEPRATIDAAHFEELLAEPEVSVATPQAKQQAKPQAETAYQEYDTPEVEPAPQIDEPPARLTLPEIRLPDLKIPQWRRPEPQSTAETAPAFDVRPEPRFASEPRPAPEPRPTPEPKSYSSRVEPSMQASRQEPLASPPPPRPDPFSAGRFNSPTRPVTSAVATSTVTTPPAPAAPPAEPEDPFESLEEEMANLLGRAHDDNKQ